MIILLLVICQDLLIFFQDLNVLLRNRFTAGIPDQWMLGQACSRRHIPEQTRLLHFSGYKPWSSSLQEHTSNRFTAGKCKKPALEVYSRTAAMIKRRLYAPNISGSSSRRLKEITKEKIVIKPIMTREARKTE